MLFYKLFSLTFHSVSIQKFQFRYQQTAVCFAEGDNQLFVGGIDNDIKVYDRRTNSIAYQLIGHGDTLTVSLWRQ